MTWSIWNDTEKTATVDSETEARDRLKNQSNIELTQGVYAQNDDTGDYIETYDGPLIVGRSR